MIAKNTLKMLASGLGIASLLVLAGCAQNQTLEDPAQSPVAQEEKAKTKATEKAAAAGAQSEEKLPDYANMNPVPIEFEKLSVKLRDADKQILVRIKDRAQKAKKLIITGYCDRKQVGNSKAAAIARANAVKSELVRMGVKPAAVRIKHATDVANKHAAEIELVAST
ncbi:MAG TPA: OmpA family protein [Noviherbaspirillum sp.]|nr:OmpA family protein [Noviherbaspirillum sp.]